MVRGWAAGATARSDLFIFYVGKSGLFVLTLSGEAADEVQEFVRGATVAEGVENAAEGPLLCRSYSEGKQAEISLLMGSFSLTEVVLF